MIPASALDGHALSTLRTVAIVLDAVPDWSVLRSRYPADHPVTVVGGASERSCTLADAERESAGASFVVVAPLDPFADLASLETVARIAERLRAPNGCPWDREQTHASLRSHLLEEAYEALAALDSGDPARLRDELGDLLLQLVRRHPHVFAGRAIAGGDLLAQWEAIKREEQGDEPKSLLSGVPRELPALFAAERMQERAARVKLVPPRLDLPLDIDDEEFLGELLFDIVAAATEAGFDAETALRAANERFAAHVARVEARAAKDGRAIESYAPDEMRRVWEETA